MNQQNQGLGIPLNVPVKRKRGRPRKEGSAVQGENVPVIPASDNVLHSNQTTGTTNDCEDEMVGKLVTGVIEGTFNAGYLLNVKVANTDAVLRGLVFVPGHFSPVTIENDVAPHAKMIQRKEIPIPVVNPHAGIRASSVPSSVQFNKQSFEPEFRVPVSEEQVPPTEIHSSISQVPENQSASTLAPISISSGGIPQGTSELRHVNQSTAIMSEFDHDKTIEQGETLHELDASTQVKESDADGGETKDSEAASELINLVPSIDNTNKEIRTGQQVVPCVHHLNEVVRGEPNISNIEFNLIPLCTEPEVLPSEQTSKIVNYFEEKQELPKTDVLEDTKTELAIQTLSNVDTSNSSGRPNTVVVNIPVLGSNHALVASEPESMPSEGIGKFVPSESKFSSEVHDLWGRSGPQNYSSFGDINTVDFNQPTEPLANPMEYEKQIGSGT
ncbi:uncharacterized protein LOC114179519 [Vigna unguiculata]|uniref:AT hook n=1 Tax=Vigna unguiculata TaxID=3917 RepID=A0A4D6KWI9_VIGUN|nr:uncharacterized protein LOC114179519 [Vigna unguiculata]QCD79729.1 hypothetical protein DEO72_LG2g43 [Vigna unguiculata]